MGEYKSYLLDCYRAVINASNEAKRRDDFIELLQQIGVDVNWSDNRKYITFTDSDGRKIRNSNLEKTFKEPFGKEDLEYAFKRNVEQANGKTRGDFGRDNECAAANSALIYPLYQSAA